MSPNLFFAAAGVARGLARTGLGLYKGKGKVPPGCLLAEPVT